MHRLTGVPRSLLLLPASYLSSTRQQAALINTKTTLCGTPLLRGASPALPSISKWAVCCSSPRVHCSQGAGDQITVELAAAGERVVRVHYYRKDHNYEGWGLHISGDPAIETSWNAPLKPCRSESDDWVFWDLKLQESGRHVELIVHKGEAKSVTCRLSEWQLYDNKQVWLVAGEQAAYLQPPPVDNILAGDLSKCWAHWCSADVLAWREPPSDSKGARSFALHWSMNAELHVSSDGLQGSDGSVPLQPDPAGLPSHIKNKFPHLSGCTALRLPQEAAEKLPSLLKSQLAVSVRDAAGQALDCTGVQLAGVLDSCYTYQGPLGCHVGPDSVAISLWAPTAQTVQLLLYQGPTCEEVCVRDMHSAADGVWRAQLDAPGGQCEYSYYRYRVSAYCPASQRVEVMEATDPYSYSLNANGQRTHICDINAPHLKPHGWEQHAAPPLNHFADISVYELHIRDFSANDLSVPQQLRGKYGAFAVQDSHGVRHLRQLAAAGLTHLHLLPSYDFGSVPEREAEQQLPQGELSSFPPDSPEQQAACLAVADSDAFNWGYDPVHYSTPEGSYSSEPDSAARVMEFRQMVAALHALGLRVVLDVVYNHTFQSGPHGRFSVLDKVVPGYYHRREENGDVCMSTCCNNTASEHAMCERLVLDDLEHWARDYKVDGFRFDIMGHLMMSTMTKAQRRLAALTLDKDGVDGSKIYIYGEAWDFGEVAFNQRGRNAAQLNLAGTGLGSFNDRFRDAVMGGGPFAPSKMQGIVTGLATEANSYTQAEMTPFQQLDLLLEQSDLLRLSMAANLKDFQFTDRKGLVVRGKQVMYYGSTPAAYAAQPWESVNYSSCHDNQTLFDQVTMKAAGQADIMQRTRMCMMANALTALAQGIPFFHAADEMLRSKSLDRDSYNSGDWFNRIDWTYQDNNFGVGLPVASKNDYNWPLMKPLLADPALKPQPQHIALAKDHFLELLRLRYSSPLFRLPASSAVCAQVQLGNSGPQQVPAVIVMLLSSADVLGLEEGVTDPSFMHILAIFNANVVPYTQYWPSQVNALQLHPVQQQSCDPCLQQVSVDVEQRLVRVPPRTVAVLVQPRQ